MLACVAGATVTPSYLAGVNAEAQLPSVRCAVLLTDPPHALPRKPGARRSSRTVKGSNNIGLRERNASSVAGAP